ncbi:MAG: hypothetical protein ABIT10_06190 [Alteraurantiacibacter sp.]
MKRLLVLAGALALAACGNDAGDGEPAPVDSAPTSPTTVPSPLAGTYGATGADGAPWTTMLEADGRYRNTVAGELTESGTWAQTGDQLCFTPTPQPGDSSSAGRQTCQTLLNVNDDGSLVVRDESGQETTAPRIAPAE